MRVAVVAGPDPGHSFPAIALCQRFRAAADTPTLFTGVEWLEAARAAGIDAVELDALSMARPTLRHRVMLRPEAELEGATPDGVLDGILASVPVPR